MKAIDTPTQAEELRLRVYGEPTLPTLIYLPGIHGDWTLVTSFRAALKGRVRFVEFMYPRTVEWSMQEYGDAISRMLVENGVTSGWLLGESWGSQPMWELVRKSASNDDGFKVEGAVLSAGFVKHPWTVGPHLLGAIVNGMPMSMYQMLLKVYAKYAKLRHRSAPETLTTIGEFVARRTEYDREAMRWRLRLMDEYDPRPIAREAKVPVYYLAGLVDPLVPWYRVRRWLRRNCPGYRGSRRYFFADHNVLGTRPGDAAAEVIKWMGSK